MGKGLGSAVNRTRRPSKAAPAGRKPGRPGRETARGRCWGRGWAAPTPAPFPVPLNSPGPAPGRGVTRPAGRRSSKPASSGGSIVSLRLPLPPASSPSLSSSRGPAPSGAFLGSPPAPKFPLLSLSVSAPRCLSLNSRTRKGRGLDGLRQGLPELGGALVPSLHPQPRRHRSGFS